MRSLVITVCSMRAACGNSYINSAGDGCTLSCQPYYEYHDVTSNQCKGTPRDTVHDKMHMRVYAVCAGSNAGQCVQYQTCASANDCKQPAFCSTTDSTCERKSCVRVGMCRCRCVQPVRFTVLLASASRNALAVPAAICSRQTSSVCSKVRVQPTNTKIQHKTTTARRVHRLFAAPTNVSWRAPSLPTRSVKVRLCVCISMCCDVYCT